MKFLNEGVVMELTNIDELTQVKFIDYKTVFIDKRAKIGNNVLIYPNNVIEGGCEIGDNVILLPNNYIFNSKILSGTKIFNSVIEDSFVEENVNIGPFAHLRPDSKIKTQAKIGNFVEIKNSTIGQKSKVSHLSYVGDADVGAHVNVGCGVVFVNYNGKTKARSRIEDKSFIGSSVNVVAPVHIGKSVYVCAGSTVDQDVPDNAFVIGRSKIQIKPDRAKNYLKGDE